MIDTIVSSMTTFSEAVASKKREEISKDAIGYDTEDSDSDGDSDGQPTKRPRRSDDDRLKRCRERNRVHARNTRERKKLQMDGLQYRIQELIDEKMRIKSAMSENSVASILMSLAGEIPMNDAFASSPRSGPSPPATVLMFESARDVNHALEKLKMQVSAELSDDDEMLEVDHELLTRDKATCTSSDLDKIRRERNRMHAKKTRLRKKKMMKELELVISTLETDVKELRQACIAVIAKVSGRSLEHAAWLFHRAVNVDSEQRLRNSHHVPMFLDQIPTGYGASLMFPGAAIPNPFPPYADPSMLLKLGVPKTMVPDLLSSAAAAAAFIPHGMSAAAALSPNFVPSSSSVAERPDEKRIAAAMRASGSSEALYSLLSLGRSGIPEDMIAKYNIALAAASSSSATLSEANLLMNTLAHATTSITDASPDEGRDIRNALKNSNKGSVSVPASIPVPAVEQSNRQDLPVLPAAGASEIGNEKKEEEGEESLKIVRSQFKPPASLVGSHVDHVLSAAAAAASPVRLSVENLAAHTEAMERAANAESVATATGSSISDRVHSVTEASAPIFLQTELSKGYPAAAWPMGIAHSFQHQMGLGNQMGLGIPFPWHGQQHNMGLGPLSIPPAQLMASRAYMAEYCNMMMPAPMRAAAGLRPSMSSPTLSSLINCCPPSRFEPSQQFTASNKTTEDHTSMKSL